MISKVGWERENGFPGPGSQLPVKYVCQSKSPAHEKIDAYLPS